ncbi:MAG: T9SS type A sorting domain-containing protein, partial [Candidatus Kapaibacteriota bacterium]
EKSIENSFPSEKELAIERSVKINFADNSQHEKTLYLALDKSFDASWFELPPVPFADLFDIRFTNNSLLEVSENPVIKLSGVEYPLAISVDDPSNEYTFVDAVTGEVFGTISSGNKTLVINNSSNAIRVLIASGEQPQSLSVYPNPVTTSSILNYTVSEETNVHLALYDALGNEVKTFVNGFLPAGEYTLVINATEFPSGQYICKMKAGNATKVHLINIVK